MIVDFAAAFARAVPYADFLQQFGSPSDCERWRRSFEQVSLAPEHQSLIAGFTRRMPVLCMAGAWCGDCVRQCPIAEQIAQGSRLIELRFVDRDVDRDLARYLTICGAPRVPQAVFLSEDFEFVTRTADRTLSQLRRLAAQAAGATCETGLVVPGDTHQSAVVADWVAEFERAQWILRLSPKLRERHGD